LPAAGQYQRVLAVAVADNPLTVLRRPLPYTEKWFDKAQRCSQALLNWHRQIEARDTSLIEAEDLLADILHSAVFYCSVHQTAILHALMLAIAERRRLCTNGSVVWLPLTLESKALAIMRTIEQGRGYRAPDFPKPADSGVGTALVSSARQNV
jgi:hypothetical protein